MVAVVDYAVIRPPLITAVVGEALMWVYCSSGANLLK
jgi:hypothetical protein